MTQPRFHRAQPRLIVIHCLYLAKLNPVLRIGTIDNNINCDKCVFNISFNN